MKSSQTDAYPLGAAFPILAYSSSGDHLKEKNSFRSSGKHQIVGKRLGATHAHKRDECTQKKTVWEATLNEIAPN